jgi:hypothetical protein
MLPIMGRTPQPGSRRIPVSVKLSAAEAAALNAARGNVPVGAWVREAILAALPGSPAQPPAEPTSATPRRASRAKRARPQRNTGIPDMASGQTSEDTGIPASAKPTDRDTGIPAGCPHPKGRRQKGGTYCAACGHTVDAS